MKMGAFVLGYHGCDRSVGEALLAGRETFVGSKNEDDWLGHGIYFWENNPTRALEWARTQAKRPKSKIKDPFAVGAIIDPGNCLDLTESTSLGILRESYHSLASICEVAGLTLPRNEKASSHDGDLLHRNLDCAVINHVHETREVRGLESYETVRGAFSEGEELYPGAGIKAKTHIQIAATNSVNIKGIFRIPAR